LSLAIHKEGVAKKAYPLELLVCHVQDIKQTLMAIFKMGEAIGKSLLMVP
jgi:hypothetical protein